MKLLLDAGWLPNLRDYFAFGHPNQDFVRALMAAAAQIGIPAQTASRNILLYQMIIDCVKAPSPPPRLTTQFSVVVPVTNAAQLALNVTRSPGLREVGAPVIEVRDATSAADAFARGVAQIETPWVVFAHQDVYFPVGSGRALAAEFGAVATARANEELIGFVGLRKGAAGEAEPAGLVIDRIARIDHPAVQDAISMDEFAVAMTPHTVHRIDPALGWHLWGTDLCLAARSRGGVARIVRVPLYHNSYNDGALSPTFQKSLDILRAKYPHMAAIPTLCGTFGPPR
jgi:hypothetical protein